MNTSRPLLPIAVALTVALALSGCTGDDAQTGAGGDPSITTVADDGAAETETTGSTAASPDAGTGVPIADLDQDVQTLIANVAIGYEQADGVWPGFVPNEHPAVIVRKDGANEVVGAVAFNHPEPAKLGDATPVDLDGLPFRSVHVVAEPTDIDTMANLEGFDFHAQLGGVDSFAMVASATDSFFDPTTKDYVSTLLHEMFHRYQDDAFLTMNGQDVEGYAYTEENLELAVLEERALSEAIAATDQVARDKAAARFAAIRQARLAADPRVELDNSQEMFEGTARYIEHRLGDQPESGYVMDASNYDRDLITGFDRVEGVKDTFGFGRWYASGAAVLRVLDLMEVDGIAGRVEAGESQAEILAAELDVDETNREALVAEARTNYDPLGELAAGAAEAAEQALAEPSVFGDDGQPTDGTDGTGTGADDAFTDEELACLAEQGVDIEDDDVEITDEQAEACFA